MNIEAYLHITERGGIRVTKSPNSAGYDEITMKLNLEVPRALFRQPKLQADITIPDDVAMPEIITSEVTERVAEAIKTATNLDFNIKVVKYEDNE